MLSVQLSRVVDAALVESKQKRALPSLMMQQRAKKVYI